MFRVRNPVLHTLVSRFDYMVENPRLLIVDLSSLKTHLRDAGLSTLLCSEHHVTEPEKLVQQALTETLLDFTLTGAPSALVHLDGGSNFTLKSFERVLRSLRHQLHEPKRLIFGTRMHPERREVVRLTAVVGGLAHRTLRESLDTPADFSSDLPMVR
jgi:cell division GTPase FtsZ